MHHLDQIQRWMQTVIMNMGGSRAGVASDTARAVIDVGFEDIEQVVTPSRSLSALERMDIYNRAYFARLIDCLREEFPALRHAAGDDAFDQFALGYLQKYPSRSYTLNDLGKNFRKYLSESRPVDDSADEASINFADFLIDLVTLEQTYNQVFDGPGSEGKRLVQHDDLAALSPERWLESRLETVPCLCLVSLRYPAHRYISAVRKQQNPSYPKRRATRLAVSRRNFVIRRFELTCQQYSLLASLAAGESVGAAIDKAASTPGARLEKLASNLRDWFTTWTQEGFFQEVRLP
jgi:hypothetical protein